MVFAGHWIWDTRENKLCRSEVKGRQCKLETFFGGDAIVGDDEIQDWMLRMQWETRVKEGGV